MVHRPPSITARRLKPGHHLKRPKLQYLRFYEDDLDRGEVMTLREVIRMYWECSYFSPNTSRATNAALGPVIAEIGHYRVSDVDANVIRKYIKVRSEKPVWAEDLRSGNRKMRDTATSVVVRAELIKLRAALNFAIMQGAIEPRYAPKYPIPPRAQKTRRWLSRQEARILLRVARSERQKRPPTSYKVYIFLALAMFTGARKAAIQSLKWSDVDFENNTIDFRDPETTNGIKRRGVIRMMPELKAVLLEAKELNFNKTGKYVLGDRGGQQAYKPFRRFLDRHGYTDVTPHTFRHSWTTWAVQDGVPLKHIADYLKVTVAVLEGTYAHHDPNYLSPAFNRNLYGEGLEEVLRPNAPSRSSREAPRS